MNKRFVPTSLHSAYAYGVVGFAISVIEELQQRAEKVALLLYDRQPAVAEIRILSVRVFNIPTVTFVFSFDIPVTELKRGFAQAVRVLTQGQNNDETTAESDAVIYHQTSTLLQFSPPGIGTIVTHHGPFVWEVADAMDRERVHDAYQGGSEKVAHLLKQQRAGIRFMRAADRYIALEFSLVQRDALLRQGIPRDRIRVAPPPLSVRRYCDSSLASSNVTGCYGKALGVVLAAARIDGFKNIELLAAAVNILSKSGHPINLELYVGADEERDRRDQLQSSLWPGLRDHAIVRPRLPHSELISMFGARRCSSVFVCCSRYETFGLTPFEAMLSGLTTIVSDLPHRIGVAALVSKEMRFRPTPSGLAAKLELLARRRSLSDVGATQQRAAVEYLKTRGFTEVLLDCAATVRKR